MGAHKIIKVILIVVGIILFVGITIVVLQPSYRTTEPPACVDDPMHEMVETIMGAQSESTKFTQDLCMNAKEGFSAEELKEQLSNVATLKFTCDSDVCKDNEPIEVSSTDIKAHSDTKFRGLMSCTKESSTDMFNCKILIRDASQG